MNYKVLLLALFLPISIFAQSVEETQPLDRPFISDVNDMGITVNISGLIGNISGKPRVDIRGQNSVLARYNMRENLTVRVGFAPVIMSFHELSTDSVGKDLLEFDSTARQAAFSIRPGIEYHLKGTNRLDPYLALDGEAGIIGKFNAGAVTNITDTTGTATFRRTITEAGGYSLGAKASLGMNFFIAKNFALGLEYGMGVNYLVTGGDRQEVLQSDPVSGVETTKRELSSSRKFDTQFIVDPNVQFTISYFFGL